MARFHRTSKRELDENGNTVFVQVDIPYTSEEEAERDAEEAAELIEAPKRIARAKIQEIERRTGMPRPVRDLILVVPPNEAVRIKAQSAEDEIALYRAILQ